METEYRFTDPSGTEHKLTGHTHAEWDGLDDPCPVCGDTEFEHYHTHGGHFGQHQGVVIERTDYWDSEVQLFTACLSCSEILYQHPAFVLLFGSSDGEVDSIEL
jgi:hypothetical protein